MRRTGFLIAAAALALLVSGCGFKPIYATTDANGGSLTQSVRIARVNAPAEISPIIAQSLENRIALKEGETPKYDLFVDVRENAQRLAVQIDNSTTRYNYRLQARYSVVDLSDGKSFNGRAESVTSFNIVTSQYSTLYAERTAQEKAARLLADEIERDLLIGFSEDANAFDDEGETPEAFLKGSDDDILPEINRTFERDD